MQRAAKELQETKEVNRNRNWNRNRITYPQIGNVHEEGSKAEGRVDEHYNTYTYRHIYTTPTPPFPAYTNIYSIYMKTLANANANDNSKMSLGTQKQCQVFLSVRERERVNERERERERGCECVRADSRSIQYI